MNWLSLIIGLLIGWIVGMLIDYFYWRPRRICTEAEKKLAVSLRDAEANNQGLQTQLANFRVNGKRLETMEAELKQKELELVQVSNSHDLRAGELSALAANLDGRQGELDTLALNLNGRKSTLDDLAASYATTEQRLTNWEASLNARDTELADLNRRYNNQGAELAALAASLSTRQSELDGVNLTHGAAQQWLGDWEARLHARESELATLQANLDARAAALPEMEAAQSHIASLEAELAASRAESEGLNAQLSSTLAANATATEADEGGFSLAGLGAGLAAAAGAVIGAVAATFSQDKTPEIDLADPNKETGTFLLEGTGQPDTALEVLVNNNPMGIALVDENGRWSLPTTLNTAGDYEVTTRYLSDDGEPQTMSAPYYLFLTAPREWAKLRTQEPVLGEFSSVGDNMVTGSFSMSGEGEPGTNIYFWVGDSEIGQTAVADDGKWEYQTNLTIPTGTHDVIARMVNQTGRSLMRSKVRPTYFGTPDDLKIIWGIGPKIEQLLNAQGIYTFAKLAETSLEMIDQLLDEAGPRFRLSNHEAWPEQARLAAESAWDALQAYQDKLNWKKGGLQE